MTTTAEEGTASSYREDEENSHSSSSSRSSVVESADAREAEDEILGNVVECTGTISRNQQDAEQEEDDEDDLMMKIVASRCQPRVEMEQDIEDGKESQSTFQKVSARLTQAATREERHLEGSKTETTMKGKLIAITSHRGQFANDAAFHDIPGAHAVTGAGQPQEESNGPGAYAMEGIQPATQMEAGHVPNVEEAILVGSAHIANTSDVESLSSRTSGEVIEGTLLATRTTTTHPSSTNKRGVVMGLTLLVVMVGVVILLVLLLPLSDEPEHPTPESILHPNFTSDLSPAVLEELQNANSAFSRAHAWMLQDPNLNDYSAERQRLRFDMATFFYLLGGEHWIHQDGWLSYDLPECEWFNQNSSIEIGGWHHGMPTEPFCDEEGQLRILNLTDNNLTGTSSPAFQGFSGIVVLDVSNNGISGPPMALADPASLIQVMDLSYNLLQGQMVSGGGRITTFSHRILKIDGNQLFGLRPIICLLMPHLEVLSLMGNLFHTELSPGFAQCRNMTHFVVADTLFRGQIPTEFGRLSSLEELDVSGNAMIDGTLPSELGTLTGLSFLDITGTAINGSIPEELCVRATQGDLDVRADCDTIRCCNEL